jgi:hypothetical protein
MTRTGAWIVIVLAILMPVPTRAQIFDPYIIGMMAGPVSDGPSVLVLKKRQDKFMSVDTLVIACVAGAASSVVAHALPALAAATTGVGGMIGAASLMGSSVFGCLVGVGGGAAAIGTQATLNTARRLEEQWTPLHESAAPGP